jgi:ankyrin repeat protein
MFEMFGQFLLSECFCVFAARWGHLQTVRFLCEKGALYNLKDNDGATPFLMACKWNHIGVGKFFLMSRFAEPNETDKFGNTALHWAAHFGQFNVVSVLVKEFGADVNKPNNEGRYIELCFSIFIHLVLCFFNHSHTLYILSLVHTHTHTKDANISRRQMGPS